MGMSCARVYIAGYPTPASTTYCPHQRFGLRGLGIQSLNALTIMLYG